MICRRRGPIVSLVLGVVCLALACATTPRARRSRADLQSSCDRGGNQDCSTLGFQLAFGSGTHDYEQARVVFKRACDGGDLYACPYLGALYEKGLGVEKDVAQALSIYQRACDARNPLGCVHVGLMYEHGRGIEKDISKARTLYSAACDTKPGDSATGWGCAKLARLIKVESPQQAHILSKRSCDLDNLEGCQQVASDLQSTGSVADRAEAMRILDRPCKNGMTEACDQASGKKPYNWSDQDEAVPDATDSK